MLHLMHSVQKLFLCVCKIMELMVNNRLMWYLERNEIITPAQSGFHKSRSTTDQLVRFGVLCHIGFYPEAARYCYFLWSWKAYDTTWNFGILKDLYEAGTMGLASTFHSWLSLRQEIPSQSGNDVAITLPLEVFTQRKFAADFLWQKLHFAGKKQQNRILCHPWGLRGNILGSSMARWKARGRLPISANWTVFTTSHGWVSE